MVVSYKHTGYHFKNEDIKYYVWKGELSFKTYRPSWR